MSPSALVSLSVTPNRTDLRRHFQIRDPTRVPMNAAEGAHLLQQPFANNAVRSIRKHF